jgi:hypothetical protein
MSLASFYEIIGYVASTLIAVSLMMSSILKLRVINLIGAITFTIYGALIQAYPVAIVNGVIALIDIYFLFELLTKKEYFSVLPMRKDANYLHYFLNYYGKEISKYVPDFVFNPDEDLEVFFVLRNMIPAGLFIIKRKENGEVWVDLDFVIPGYRDMKIGDYIYHQKSEILDMKSRKILTTAITKQHVKYLQQMGFKSTVSNMMALELH